MTDETTTRDGLRVAVSKRDCPSPHSLANKVGRVFWGAVWLLFFRPSPRVLFGWRRLLLRLFGARIGRNARVCPSVKIWAPWNLRLGDEAALGHHVDCYCVDRITVGSHATVSQYAFLCTASHDPADSHMRLTMTPVEICDQAWVCAGVFVAPGVVVGEGAVAGAYAVVVHDVPPWTIVGGNPARVLKERILSDESGSPQEDDTS